MIEKLVWFGHASFQIKGKRKTIYIDPWKLKGSAQPADIILIGHSHYDHFSPPDILRISQPSTVIVVPQDCAGKVKGNLKIMKPGETLDLEGIEVKAIPAYTPEKPFHPKKNNWLGFIVTIDGERLYYASDTDEIPEMGKIKDIDVALLPVGGTYTMNAKEAAHAAGTIKPRIAVPYHYGDIVGTGRDAELFASLFSGETRILQPA
jgi:L-ascorbate metabolism protein UlaG (beta-lactamase superfamily)